MSSININIYQIRNLDFDGELVLKLEFGDKVLGESEKIINTPGSFVSIDFSVKHDFEQADYNTVDELVSMPLICSLFEVSTTEKIDDRKDSKKEDKKDSKKEDKREKFGIIAQCSFGLQQFVLGETFVRSSFPLQPYVGSAFEQNPNSFKAEIDASMCCDAPMVSEDDLKNGNLLSITVESLMSTPNSWESSGQNFLYIATLGIPRTEEDDTVGVLPFGKFLKPLEDKEVHDNRKKWPLPGSAVGGAAFMSGRMLGCEKFSDESGDLRTCEYFEFRRNAYMCKPRVQWNMERNFYLGKAAVERLKCKILQSRYLPLEIYRISADIKGEEENALSFHGVAYMDVTPLIHPGGSRIRGAYMVTGFNEEEWKNKTKHTSMSVAEESRKMINNLLSKNSSSLKLAKKEDAKEKKERKMANAGNKNKLQSPKAEDDLALVSEDKRNQEAEQFSKAMSYVMVEISLNHPFYQRKSATDAMLSVSNTIPQRPLYPKKTNSSEKAMTDYRNKIASIASLLLKEFEKYVEPEGSGDSNEQSFEERRQKLLYHLNSSGKYLAFKEQIRHAVVKIVRDTLCRTTVFDCHEEFQCFLSELYTMLVDEMHSSLTAFIEAEEKPESIKIVLTEDQLKHFAQEADVVGKHSLAEKYYFERISQDRRNPNYWFDAGCHYMLTEDFNRAGECFKESVAVNCEFVNGLGNIVVLWQTLSWKDCTGAAECLFEAATAVDPSNILAWVMLGLFYNYVSNSIMFESSIAEACRLALGRPDYVIQCCQEKIEQEDVPLMTCEVSQSPVEATHKKPSKKALGKSQDSKEAVAPLPEPAISVRLKDSVYVDAVTFLRSANEVIFREKALERHVEDCCGGFNVSYYLEMSRLYVTKKLYCEADQFINIAIEMCMQDPQVWTASGHLKYCMKDFDAAICCYERRISYGTEDDDLHYVYLRLGAAYTYMQKFQEAKQTYLKACKKKATCLTWLGAGIACYRLSQLKEAEEALVEANFLNNDDSEVWGYLCLISMQRCRHFEAKQAYKHAMRAGLCNASLCDEITKLQEATGISLH